MHRGRMPESYGIPRVDRRVKLHPSHSAAERSRPRRRMKKAPPRPGEGVPQLHISEGADQLQSLGGSKKQVRKSKKSCELVTPSVLKSALLAKNAVRKSKKSWEFRTLF